ncbi:MAG TPA: transcription elongation factor GreA [Candidatus Limnocylindrales bacterium]|nr:transcription elongation factor GreA [Candidatus Limnocylindrales bacterium]
MTGPPPPNASENGAAGLLRAVDLMGDGPVVWGRPVGARGPGVFVVELPATRATAPLELTRIGKWLERVPGLRLDGERPTSRALAARMAAFWLPSTRVVYIGATGGSIAGRIEAMTHTGLGERRPHPGAHWLQALIGLELARIWWAPTPAVEEYEDALLGAFAATIPAADRDALHDRRVILPFANLRTVTGERKATGLSNSLVPAEPVRSVPAGRVVDVAPGAALGAGGLPTGRARAAGGTVRRTSRATPRTGAARSAGGGSSGTRASRAAAAAGRPREETYVSAEGLARLQLEHDELVGTQRPAVIGRIKAAKELGDLKENADYSSAREEQSFLEGRIKTIEAVLRDATVIEAPVGEAAARVRVGSTVTVEEDDGTTTTFAIVGSTEADPAAGRISNVSPVGRALMGRSAGDALVVVTPRGEIHYRITDLA